MAAPERLFANHRLRRLVFSLLDEECLTQPIVQRPLQEIDRDDDPRLEPPTLFHLVGRNSGSPSPFDLSGRLTNCKSGIASFGEAELRLPRRGRQVGAHAARVFEFAAVELGYENLGKAVEWYDKFLKA
jgi:hypothetical protein